MSIDTQQTNLTNFSAQLTKITFFVFSCFWPKKMRWRETENDIVFFCIFASEQGLKFFKHFFWFQEPLGSSEILPWMHKLSAVEWKSPPSPLKLFILHLFLSCIFLTPLSLSYLFSSFSKSEYSLIFSHNLVLYAIIGNTHFLDPLGQVVFLGWYSF